MTFARVLVIASFAFWLSVAIGQSPDRVWLEPPPRPSTQSDWYPRAIEIVEARIMDLDDKQLCMMISGDEVETIVSASRVIWVELGDVPALQADAIKNFESGRYAECLSLLPDILKERPPVWRQQWLTMMGANAARESSRAKITLELVSQLDRRELPPLVIAWLPIAWDNRSASADEISAASVRLDDPSPATRLVAASWLLSSPRRADAVDVLKSLTADASRPLIADLAKCLLWRTATPPQVKQLYPDWQNQLADLPMAVQTGPMISLADKLKSSGLPEAARRWEWSLELTPISAAPPRSP